MNKILGILLLLVYICAATALLSDAFITPYNMQNFVRYSALYGIIGIGVALVIITGGIDLSIGSLIGLVGCLLPMLLIQRHWSVAASLGAVLLVSLLLGLAHGLLITKMNLQPFIVTLCGLLIYRGVARWITVDQTQGFGTAYDNSLRLLATGKPCSVAFLILFAGILAMLWFGLRLFVRTGADREARPLAVPVAGFILGVALTVIGSARYWPLEPAAELISNAAIQLRGWTRLRPTDPAQLPQALMSSAWIGLIPSALWLVAGMVRRDWKRTVGPLLAFLVAAGLVWGAVKLIHQPDSWFVDQSKFAADPAMGMELAARRASQVRLGAVFLSLGLMMGAIGWLYNRAVRIWGPGAQPPLLLTGGSAVLFLLGQTPLAQTPVPSSFLILLVLAALASVFLNLTIFGRYLLALGRNEEAARFSGINTDRMIILAYVLCAGAAGIGGILFALDGNSIQPGSHGNFFELYAIAAAVLGGCSLRGGEGTVLGVIIGAAMMRVLYNAINILGIPSQLEYAIIGTVILVGVLADELVKRFAARRTA